MTDKLLRSEGTGAVLVLVLSGTIATLVAGRFRAPALGALSGVLSNPVPRRTSEGRAVNGVPRSGSRPTPGEMVAA